MARRTVRISRFQDLEGLYEIVGQGGVSLPRGDAQEFEVDIYLARRDASTKFFVSDSIRRRSIGCGQLDLLAVGSLWSGGRREVESFPDQVETRVVRLQSASVRRGLSADGLRRDFPDLPLADVPCFDLRFPLDSGSPGRAIVPKLELARALCGASSSLLLDMIDGIRDGSVAADRGLFDRVKSRRISDTTVEVHASRRLSRKEAIVIAAYLTDPRLRAFFDGVFQSLVVQPGFTSGQTVFLDPPVPFSSETVWTFGFRWFTRSSEVDGSARERGQTTQNIRFVTQILALGFPLAFETVEVHTPPSSTTMGSEGMPPRPGRTRVGSSRRAKLGTGRAPGRGRHVLELQSPDVANPAEKRVNVVHQPSEPVVQPPSARIKEGDVDDAEFSTAGRDASSSSNVRPAQIVRGPLSEVEAADLARRDRESVAATLAAVRRMIDEEEGAAEWDYEIFSGPDAVIPAPAFADLEPHFRDMLIVEIETLDGFALVVDVGTTDGLTRSFAIMRMDGGGNATPEEIEQVRELARFNGGHWRGKPKFQNGFHIAVMHRITKGPDPIGDQARNIFEAIRSTLKGRVLPEGHDAEP